MADVAEKPTEEIVATEPKEKPAGDEPSPKVVEPASDDSSPKVVEPVAAEAAENGGDSAKLERAIIRQVEYYFGDANLNRDKYLLEQISKDPEGWVPFSVLLTFKRLANLSTDAAVIVDALNKSDEGLVEISEDKLKLRRHPERPVPEHNEERRKEVMSRTAYAKGFPLDTEMAQLIDFFTPFGVININMRKYLDKPSKSYMFKGSVFATFPKREQAQAFLEKEKVLFQDRELLRKWQDKYLEDKKEEKKLKAKKNAKPAEEDKFELPKGTVVFFEGAPETMVREVLREKLDSMEGDFEVAYIDFNKGDKDGHIRFQEANTAVNFLAKLENNKLQVKEEIELTLRTLTEEEEKTYLEKAVEQMKQRRSYQKHKGGHGHNRKRRGGNDNRNDAKVKKHSNDD